VRYLSHTFLDTIRFIKSGLVPNLQPNTMPMRMTFVQEKPRGKEAAFNARKKNQDAHNGEYSIYLLSCLSF
jgi:hypothetical protein